MKLDSDIKGFVRDVSIGCGILCAIEIVAGTVFSVARFLNLTGSFREILSIVLGALGGTLVAILCFFWMAVSLQKSLDTAANGGEQVNRGVQAGYNKRLMAQGVWILIAIFVPFINTICGLAPLLFPKLAIYVLQITGKLNLTQTQSTPGAKGGET